MWSLQFEKIVQHNHPSNVPEETKEAKHEKGNPLVNEELHTT